LGVVSTVIGAGAFVGLGVAGGKGARRAFITGLILYAIDLVLTVFLSLWIGVALHAYALYCLFLGVGACSQLAALRRAQPAGLGQAAASDAPQVAGPDWNTGLEARPQSKLYDPPGADPPAE
jgi:hypothetical protein